MGEEILTLVRALGHVEGEQKEALEALCTAAAAEVRGWLRPGVSVEACRGAFPLAAAWLALAGLAAGGSGGVEDFTAGEVSIRMSGGQEAAARSEALRRQARQIMAPYIRDEGFVFRGVGG